ncbi:gas vesicle protein [Egicoccus sp. AB-alg2]|uniref:gas vesicle protein n=1 Tax=Egicoccus sp. AB-alg2 TaxID=3242693 RepID=UPI00359E3A1F
MSELQPAPRPETVGTAESDETTLVDVLDRVIDRGVVISGDVILGVAGVDLIYLGVRLVLHGIDPPELP